HTAIDRGVRLIDTAPAYGFDRSKEIVVRGIDSGSRSREAIATKVCLEWKNGKVFRNASGDRIQREIEDSLRRLRTDYIDIYQVHWPDPLVPIEETAEAMQTRRARHTHLTITAGDLKCPRMPYFRLISA